MRFIEFIHIRAQKKELTKKGNLKTPSKNEIYQMFSDAYGKFGRDAIVIRNGFKITGFMADFNNFYEDLHFNLKNSAYLENYSRRRINESLIKKKTKALQQTALSVIFDIVSLRLLQLGRSQQNTAKKGILCVPLPWIRGEINKRLI